MHILPPDPPAPRAGILFAEDFDDAQPMAVIAPEPEPIAPSFSAEDVADARREGFAAGQHAARDEAAQRLQDAARQSCERLGELALRAEAMHEAHLREATEATARLIFSALLAALPSLALRHASSEITHLVRNILAALTSGQILTIKIAPEILAPLREALAAAPRDVARRVTLSGDDAMAPGDARLTWEGGAASRQPHLAQDGLAEILTSLDLLPTAPTRPAFFAAEPAAHHLETSHG